MTCTEATEPFSGGRRLIVSHHGSCSCGAMPDVRYRSCYSWSAAEGLPQNGKTPLWVEDSTQPVQDSTETVGNSTSLPTRVSVRFVLTSDLPAGYIGKRSFTETRWPLVGLGNSV